MKSEVLQDSLLPRSNNEYDDESTSMHRSSNSGSQSKMGSFQIGVLGLLTLNLALLIAVLAKINHEHVQVSCDTNSAPASASSANGNGQYTNAICSALCSPVCVAIDTSCFGTCYATCTEQQGFVRPAELGSWILPNAVQHVGLTTSNLSRSVRFYTEVLGGVEVNGAGGDGWKGDRVYQLLMQAALIRGGDAATWAANLSSSGPDVLNARYVAFGNVFLELLDYRAVRRHLRRGRRNPNVSGTEAGVVLSAAATRSLRARRVLPASGCAKPAGAFPTFSASNVAPSVSGNMHISFNIRPTVSLNQFVDKFIEVSKSPPYSYDNVLCNRLVNPPSAATLEDNSYFVTNGSFQGWQLAYCKGPDGEQLEFNQVIQQAAVDFDQSLRQYLTLGTNPSW